jgi:hypothetical protein
MESAPGDALFRTIREQQQAGDEDAEKYQHAKVSSPDPTTSKAEDFILRTPIRNARSFYEKDEDEDEDEDEDDMFEEEKLDTDAEIEDALVMYGAHGLASPTYVDRRSESATSSMTLSDIMACLPLNVKRHRQYLVRRLVHVCSNQHLFFSPGQAASLAPSHVDLLAELLRLAYAYKDECLVGLSTSVIKLVFQLKPSLAAASSAPPPSDAFAGTTDAGRRVVEQSLMGHLVKIAICHSVYSDALFSLQLMVSGTRRRWALNFVLGLVFSLSHEPGLGVAYDNFAAILPVLVRQVVGASVRGATSAAANELWQALALALSALAPRVRPSVRGRVTGRGNGLFLPQVLGELRAACEARKGARAALLSLFGSLARLHPSHAGQLLSSGVVQLALDFVLHSLVMGSKGSTVAEADQALVGQCLDFLAEVVLATPHGAGSRSAGAIVVTTLSVARVSSLGAMMPVRHADSTAYLSLLKFARAALPAAPGLAPWLQTAQEELQEAISAGWRVGSSCRALALLLGATPGFVKSCPPSVLAAACRFVEDEEGHVGAVPFAASTTEDALEGLLELLMATTPWAGARKGYWRKAGERDEVTACKALLESLPDEARAALRTATSSSSLPSEALGKDQQEEDDEIEDDCNGDGKGAEDSSSSTTTRAYVSALLSRCEAMLHPVRFFAWPTLTTQQLHARLLSLLMLSRLHHQGLIALVSGAGVTVDGASPRVGLGELGAMLQCLLTGAAGRVAAPSSPSSTVFTFLVAPHAHTNNAPKVCPALPTTVQLLLADVWAAMRALTSLPSPHPDPLPVVRVVVQQLERARVALPTGSVLLLIGAQVRLLSEAEAAARKSSQVGGLAALTPATARLVPAAIARVLEPLNDVLSRSDGAVLLPWVWALLRCPDALESTASLAQDNDCVASLLLRWVLFGLRYRDWAGAAAGEEYSLAQDTTELLLLLASDMAPQPRAQALFRYICSRPEVERALLDLAAVGAKTARTRCALDVLVVALDHFNPHPYLGYDCPELFFSTARSFPATGPGGARVRAERELLQARAGVPGIVSRLLDSLSSPSSSSSGASSRLLLLVPSMFRLGARWLELRAAAEEEQVACGDDQGLRGSGAGAAMATEWVRARLLPLAFALLVHGQSSASCLSGLQARAESLSPSLSAAAAEVWDDLGGACCELVEASVTTSPTTSPSSLAATLDCLLDALPHPQAASKRLLGGVVGAAAAVAMRGGDVASEGRGTAVLQALEGAISVGSSPDDVRLHNAAAKLLSVLSRSSDAIRDVIVAGPVVRFLAVVLTRCRGPVELSRSVGLRREDARVLVDLDVLRDDSTVVLACQTAASLANTAFRAQRLHRAAVPQAVLWLMSKHATFRDSLKMQRQGLAAVLAAWNCKTTRQSLLLQEGHEEAVARAVDMLQASLARGGWPKVEAAFTNELLEQIRAQRTEVDCMMS